jgi:ribose/xylose/arabinose/galactoside ABC-type transport system permease subunit
MNVDDAAPSVPRPAGPGAGTLTAAHVIVPVVTLVLGWVVALGLLLSSDLPDGYLDRVLPLTLTWVVLVVPVALLFSWGEIDLSVLGTPFLAGYLYIEVGDGSVALGLLVAGLVCLLFGVLVGLARWLTRAPSAVLSLAAGAIAQALALRTLETSGSVGSAGSRVDGSALPFLAALGVTGVAVLLAVIVRRPAPEGGDDRGPGPEVIAGFGLSGLAAGIFGAIFTGLTMVASPGIGTNMVLVLFTAVAMAGVVRGSGIVAPLAAVLGTVGAFLLTDGSRMRNWDVGDANLLLAAVFAVLLLVGHGLYRALAGIGAGVGPAAGPGPPVTASSPPWAFPPHPGTPPPGPPGPPAQPGG